MNTAIETTTGRELRWLADNYEQAQALRIGIGERLRAVIQGRDQTFTVVAAVDPAYADEMLADIARGETLGPVPMLGRSYRRYYEEEQATRKDMLSSLSAHPASSWALSVKGIGPTLACKLLARLDVRIAEHRSSFWKYCGLATVPGELYRCSECGLETGYPDGYKVTGKHKALNTEKNCKGVQLKIAGPEDGIRVAQPRAERGKARDYDAYAKKIMYLIGTSFLKTGGPYEEYYRAQRATVEIERPGWAKARRHYWAFRKTQKLFLSHLWEVWRQAEKLPIDEPYAIAELGHSGYRPPSEFTEVGK